MLAIFQPRPYALSYCKVGAIVPEDVAPVQSLAQLASSSGYFAGLGSGGAVLSVFTLE
jgi:hypothetical protein